jgi:hypothetical protein
MSEKAGNREWIDGGREIAGTLPASAEEAGHPGGEGALVVVA